MATQEVGWRHRSV